MKYELQLNMDFGSEYQKELFLSVLDNVLLATQIPFEARHKKNKMVVLLGPELSQDMIKNKAERQKREEVMKSVGL